MLTLKRPHYAWVICFAGVLGFCASMGVVSNLFALLLPDVILEHGLTKSQGSWLTTTRSLFSLAAVLVVNQLCSRFGLRKVMSFGCALTATAYLLLSRASSFASCCVACALLGCGYSFSGPVPISLMLGRWFKSRRNLALGLSSAGSGLVTIIAPPILTRIQEQRGLFVSLMTLSVTAVVLCIVMWLLVRNSPEDVSLSPYYEELPDKKAAPVRTEPRPMSLVQKGMLLLATLLMAAPAAPGFTHIAVFFRSEGYREMLVASLVSCLGFVLLVGKILCGQVYDRFGGRLGNLYTYGMLLTGHALFLLVPAGYSWLAFLSVAVYGMGVPISSVSTAKWASDLNSEADYAASVRSINTAYSLGALLFGPIPGTLADRFGSYLPAYILFALMAVISYIILSVVYRQVS